MRPIFHSLGTVALCLAAGAAMADPSVSPTGTTLYDPSRAFPSLVLFSGGDDHTHLIDMNGHEVHRWDQEGLPSVLLDPALTGGQTGHVLLQTSHGSGEGTSALPGMPTAFKDKTVGELDWSGGTVWEWGTQVPGGSLLQHHDIRRLPNGDTLILADVVQPVPGFKAPKLLDDVIYDVAPSGEIVWRWLITDHLDELGFTADALELVKQSGVMDCFHVNDMAPLGPNKWFDSGDARFAPDNIMISSRDANIIAIISRSTGHVAWRLGPDYPPFKLFDRRLPRPVDQINGQHDPHLIEPGLPGAGNLLVFDNQGPAGYPQVPLDPLRGSRVLEIDPVGKQIVWQYSAAESQAAGWTFHSPFISNARRLPNGNTFINEGVFGRFFQVTPAGDIVWEYVSPYRGSYPGPGAPANSNWVYRAQPVPYSWVPADTPHTEDAVAR